MSHVALTAPADEREEHLFRLNLDALEQLAASAAPVDPRRKYQEHVREWAERQRITSRCWWCDYCRADVTLVEARREFAGHPCSQRPS